MTERPDPRPVFLDEHGNYVFEDGTPVPDQPVSLREALIGALVTFALVIVIPLLIGFAAYRTVVNDQIDANEDLIERVNLERIARTRVINEFIYEQCVQAEIRDVVIVRHLRDDLREARATLPAGSPVLREKEQSVIDGINALEPENEQDCRPPPATQPKGHP